MSQSHTKLYTQAKQNRFYFTYFPLAKDEPMSQHLVSVILKEGKKFQNPNKTFP